eukprot:6200599-Pleurochrysis_carterae.AAC.1
MTFANISSAVSGHTRCATGPQRHCSPSAAHVCLSVSTKALLSWHPLSASIQKVENRLYVTIESAGQPLNAQK